MSYAAHIHNPALAPFIKSEERIIHNSLRKWRQGWPETLLDFKPFPESLSLYQDRAEAYWYLAGIIILPSVALTLPSSSLPSSNQTRKTGTSPGTLSVQQILERLMVLSDQSCLQTLGDDFNATYGLCRENPLNLGTGALGGLIYREVDATRAEFDE